MTLHAIAVSDRGEEIRGSDVAALLKVDDPIRIIAMSPKASRLNSDGLAVQRRLLNSDERKMRTGLPSA
jgi:hypothetical protein